MGQYKIIIILFLITIIALIIIKNKKKWFGENLEEDKLVVNEEITIDLNNVLYETIENTNVFYINENEILLETNGVFFLSDKVLTNLNVNDFLNNNDVIYEFFNIKKEEKYILKQNDETLIVYFTNLDVLFFIKNDGFYILQDSKELKNIKFNLNNKIIKKEYLINYINKKDVI